MQLQRRRSKYLIKKTSHKRLKKKKKNGCTIYIDIIITIPSTYHRILVRIVINTVIPAREVATTRCRRAQRHSHRYNKRKEEDEKKGIARKI